MDAPSMCNQVVSPAGEPILDVSQLAALVGEKNIVWSPYFKDEPELTVAALGDQCLCPVDLRATIERAGFAVAETDGVVFKLA